jgi:hypothetical protein
VSDRVLQELLDQVDADAEIGRAVVFWRLLIADWGPR